MGAWGIKALERDEGRHVLITAQKPHESLIFGARKSGFTPNLRHLRQKSKRTIR